jgi:hypothetical protein
MPKALKDNEVQWIQGAGQMVFWNQCSVTVIEEGIYTPLELLHGEGKVGDGIILCMFGGKVKVAEKSTLEQMGVILLEVQLLAKFKPFSNV